MSEGNISNDTNASQPSLNQLKDNLFEYLTVTFGEDFPTQLQLPKNVTIGERVLYKLKGSAKAVRIEQTQDDIDDFQKTLVDIVSEVEGSQLLPMEPVVSSGLPYARMVDIPGWSIAYDFPANDYLNSDELLPEEDFKIEWLFGLMFGHSEKKLVYIDFSHPKVKSIFSIEYDVDMDTSPNPDILNLFKQFKLKRIGLIKASESDSKILWSKLVQINDKVSTKTKEAV